MKPDILFGRIHILPQYPESIALTSPHLAHLLIEKAGDGDSPKHEINDDIIDHVFLFFRLVSINI